MAEEGAQIQEEAKSLEVIYSLAARQLDEQLKEVEGVDTKLGLVFGVSSVIIGLYSHRFPLRTSDQANVYGFLAHLWRCT